MRGFLLGGNPSAAFWSGRQLAPIRGIEMAEPPQESGPGCAKARAHLLTRLALLFLNSWAAPLAWGLRTWA